MAPSGVDELIGSNAVSDWRCDRRAQTRTANTREALLKRSGAITMTLVRAAQWPARRDGLHYPSSESALVLAARLEPRPDTHAHDDDDDRLRGQGAEEGEVCGLPLATLILKHAVECRPKPVLFPASQTGEDTED